MAAPGVLALLTTSAPDEPARLRALALFGAVSSGGMSLGLLLGGAVTDLGSWRWTLFINVPIGLGDPGPDPALPRRDPAPARPLRLRRRAQRDRRRRRPRLDADRRPRARLDLGPHGRSASSLGAALLALLAVTERRVAHPLLRPALLQEPAPGRRPGRDRPGRRRPAVDVLPRRAVHRARARLRADGLGAGVPAADPRHLRDVAGDPADHGRGRPAADDRDRRDRALRQLRLAEHAHRRRRLPGAGSSARCSSTASRPA